MDDINGIVCYICNKINDGFISLVVVRNGGKVVRYKKLKVVNWL